MNRRFLIHVGVILALACARLSFAAASDTAQNPTVSATIAIGGLYASGQPVDVSLLLRNPTDSGIVGRVTIGVGRDNHIIVTQTATVSAHSSLRVDTAIHPGKSGDDRAMTPGEVAPVVWTDDGGRQIGRTVLTGTRVSGQRPPAGDLDSRHVLSGVTTAVLVLDTHEAIDASDTIGRQLTQAGDRFVFEAAVGEAADLPRSTDGFGPFSYVAIGTSLDAMDVAQQHALLDYVRKGGTLIVWGSRPEDLANNWLTPKLPVTVIGSRRAIALQPTGSSKPIRLTADVGLIEAVERRARGEVPSTIVSSDDSFVHAAWRPVGLGRVVFLGVAPSALDAKSDAVRAIWQTLLKGSGQPSPDVPSKTQQTVLGELLGRSAPTVTLPAAVAGGYLLLAVAAHSIFRGARRPAAHAIVLGGAALLSAGLVAFTAMHGRAPVLSTARLTAVELGADGTGARVEQSAYCGPASNSVVLQQSQSPRIVGWPGVYDAKNAPSVQSLPLVVHDADIREDGLDRIWQLTRAYDGPPVRVTGRFGASGLSLTGVQGLSTVLSDPSISWGGAMIRLPNLPGGSIDVRVDADDLNPPGVFTHGSGLVSATDRQRAELLQGWLEARQVDFAAGPTLPVYLLGWPSPPAMPPLLETKGVSMKSIVSSQTLLSAVVPIEPSTAGRVRIDGPFNRFARVGDAAIPPLDVTGSADGNAPLDWVMAVAPPPAVGAFRPTHATLSIDLDTPQHEVTVQAGQFSTSGGNSKSFSPVADAPPLAVWDHGFGHKDVSFDIVPRDVSPQGLLVLRLSIQPPGGSSTQTAHWAVHRMSVTLSGEVDSPARP